MLLGGPIGASTLNSHAAVNLKAEASQHLGKLVWTFVFCQLEILGIVLRA